MNHLKHLAIMSMLCALMVSMTITASHAGPQPSTPYVTISDVSVQPNTVCGPNADEGVTLSASITGTYDSGPVESILEGNWGNISDATSPCGHQVNQSRTVTKTVTTYSNKKLKIDGTEYNAESYSYTKTYSAGSPDDEHTLTVTAQSLEDKTITTYTRTDYRNKQGSTITNYCEGIYSLSSGPTTTTIASSVVSAEDTYLADRVGPTIKNFVGTTEVQQGEGVISNVIIEDGSAGAGYTVTYTAAGPSNLGPYSVTDTFKTNGAKGGVAVPESVGPTSLSTSCTTPIGLYTLTAEVKSDDLCGNLDAYTTSTTRQFTVTYAGIALQSDTIVLSEFPTGDYGIDQCFNSKAVNRKINNEPGHVHIGQIVTSIGTGECATIDLTGVRLTLTLPEGFSYAVSGKSPAAHVFVFPAGADLPSPGFDLHYPPNEVTSFVTQTRNGQTIEIDLTDMDPISSTMTIYARAKAVYSSREPAWTSQEFEFRTSVSANGELSDDSTYTIIGNPSSGCLNGLLVQP